MHSRPRDGRACRAAEDIIEALPIPACAASGASVSPPAGRGIVRQQMAPRLMAVNIDEGEPGPSRTAPTSSATRIASSKAC